jgi:predicted small lipoprotein YifL
MKKLLMVIALFTFPTMVLTGCSSKTAGPIETSSPDDGSMPADQQAEYEKQMQEMGQAGGGGSQRPGN